jgi:hypothetical protein
MKLTRPNRGNRLKELITEGFSDEDEITDAWKETANDSDASVEETSDTADSDFSASEHSSTLSGASKASWDSDSRPQKTKQALKPLRARKLPKISQATRLTAAFDHARTHEALPRGVDNPKRTHGKTRPPGLGSASLVFRSNDAMLKLGCSHVRGAHS